MDEHAAASMNAGLNGLVTAPAITGIDQWISSLERLTFDLVQNIQHIGYDMMLEFMEQREQLISQILANPLIEPVKSKYKETIDRILACDPLISARINELKAVESAGLNKTQNARLQKSVYEAAYIPDSIYFDKKK